MDGRRAREWRACHTNTTRWRAEAGDKVQLLSSVLVTKGQQSTHGQRSHGEVLCTIDCMVTLYIHVLPCWRLDTKPCPEWTPRYRRRSRQQISALCPLQSVNIGLRLRNNMYWCYSEVLNYPSLMKTQKETLKIVFGVNCSHVFYLLENEKNNFFKDQIYWQKYVIIMPKGFPTLFKKIISIPSHHQKNLCSRGNYWLCLSYMIEEI